MLYTQILEARAGHTPVNVPAAATYSKEMSLTPEQFIAALPAAFKHTSSTITWRDHEATVISGASRAVIGVSKRPDRKLGSLTLPVLKVDFRLTGYTGNDVRNFHAAFDRSFLRMGG